MKLSRQHFQMIAEVLHEWADGYDQTEEAQVLAELFADRLASTNGMFNRDRFMRFTNIHTGAAMTGSDEFYLGSGQQNAGPIGGRASDIRPQQTNLGRAFGPLSFSRSCHRRRTVGQCFAACALERRESICYRCVG